MTRLMRLTCLFPSQSHFVPSSGQAVVAGVVPPPPGTCRHFYRAECSARPLLVDVDELCDLLTRRSTFPFAGGPS